MADAAAASSAIGGAPWARHAVVLVAVVAVVACMGGIATQLVVLWTEPTDHGVPWPLIQNGSFTLAAAVLGGALSRRMQSRPVGLVMLVAGVSGASALLLSGAGGTAHAQEDGTSTLLLWLSQPLWPFFAVLPLTLLPLLFPSGLLPGVFWRIAAVASIVVSVGLSVATAIHPEIIAGGGVRVANPWALPEAAVVLVAVLSPAAVVCALLGIAALVIRYVRGSALVRRQIVLFGLAVVVAVAMVVTGPILPDTLFQILATLAPLFILGSIALAVARDKLYDVDLVVNRALLYSTLTVVLTALFVAVSATALALATLIPFPAGPWAAAATAAVVVVLCAEPLRRGLQRRLEHRLLGDRRRPLEAMARLRRSVATDDVEQSLARTIAESVRSPSVVVEIADPEAGGVDEATSVEVVVPLVHDRERIGRLRVTRRSPGEEYGGRDLDLLRQLAAEAATILYALRQERELAAARREAITIAAEERARLGRDLHDGLGPLLAGAGLTAEALRSGLARGSPDDLDAARLAERLRSAAGDIRRIARELQPSPLADSTFDAALSDYVGGLRGPGVPRMTLEVKIGTLPPAVAEAAYFVVLESVNNVVRHAQASTSDILVEQVEGALSIDIVDDGVGLGDSYISGVGLTSLRRRVTALGGSLSVGRGRVRGTRLSARIPVPT